MLTIITNIFQFDITIEDKASKLVEFTQNVTTNGIGDIQAVADVINSINMNKEDEEKDLGEKVTEDIVKTVSFLVDSNLKTNLTEKAADMSNK